MPNINNKEKYGACTVEGCPDWSCAAGLCNRHYLKKSKYGTPTAGREIVRGLTPDEKFDSTGWVEDENGCWIWNGNIDGSGYGQYFHKSEGHNKRYGAHRTALERKIGRSLSGSGADKEYALHKCDVRNCVNPDHLFVGTHLDNMKDMYVKKRVSSKISDDDVHEIFRLRYEERLLQREIADIFGLTQPYVSEILSKSKRRMTHND